jgi:uncharacterized protein YggT (Ycf19 family)
MFARFAAGIVDFFVGIAEIFLALRFILLFFTANRANDFVGFIYNSSDALLQPFRGIFPTTTVGQDHLVSFSTLFAMVIYALFGAVVIAFLHFLGSAGDRHKVSKKSR